MSCPRIRSNFHFVFVRLIEIHGNAIVPRQSMVFHLCLCYVTVLTRICNLISFNLIFLPAPTFLRERIKIWRDFQFSNPPFFLNIPKRLDSALNAMLIFNFRDSSRSLIVWLMIVTILKQRKVSKKHFKALSTFRILHCRSEKEFWMNEIAANDCVTFRYATSHSELSKLQSCGRVNHAGLFVLFALPSL